MTAFSGLVLPEEEGVSRNHPGLQGRLLKRNKPPPVLEIGGFSSGRGSWTDRLVFAGPAGLRRENESGKRQFRQLEATAVLDSVLGKVSEKQSYTLGRGEGGQLNQKEVLGSLTAGEEALEWVGSGGTQGGWWAAGRTQITGRWGWSLARRGE